MAPAEKEHDAEPSKLRRKGIVYNLTFRNYTQIQKLYTENEIFMPGFLPEP